MGDLGVLEFHGGGELRSSSVEFSQFFFLLVKKLKIRTEQDSDERRFLVAFISAAEQQKVDLNDSLIHRHSPSSKAILACSAADALDTPGTNPGRSAQAPAELSASRRTIPAGVAAAHSHRSDSASTPLGVIRRHSTQYRA